MLHGTTKGKTPSNEIKIIVILLNGLLQLHGLFIYFFFSRQGHKHSRTGANKKQWKKIKIKKENNIGIARWNCIFICFHVEGCGGKLIKTEWFFRLKISFASECLWLSEGVSSLPNNKIPGYWNFTKETDTVNNDIASATENPDIIDNYWLMNTNANMFSFYSFSFPIVKTF